SPVDGSMTSQLMTSVESSKNGSMNAVPASGSRIMSDSLMPFQPAIDEPSNILDRKSTRLNSSHVKISYAVFCLKKKKISSFEICDLQCQSGVKTVDTYNEY